VARRFRIFSFSCGIPTRSPANQCVSGLTNDGLPNRAAGIQTLSQAIRAGFMAIDAGTASLLDTADELKAVAGKLGRRCPPRQRRQRNCGEAVGAGRLPGGLFATHGLVARDVAGLGEPSLALTLATGKTRRCSCHTTQRGHLRERERASYFRSIRPQRRNPNCQTGPPYCPHFARSGTPGHGRF
jgi:hypothetical protein